MKPPHNADDIAWFHQLYICERWNERNNFRGVDLIFLAPKSIAKALPLTSRPRAFLSTRSPALSFLRRLGH